MNLEDRLAAELHRDADATPEAIGDLAAVKRVARRRTVVTRTGIVAAVAAVTILAIGSVALLRPALDGTANTPTSTPPVVVATTTPPTTTVTTVIVPSIVTVAAKELEIDVDAWTRTPFSELETRPLVVGEDEMDDIASAATDVLSAMGAKPPYSATVIQRTNAGQIVLLTHATGSCITDLALRGPWSVHDDPVPCMPTDQPAAWQIGSLRLIVWPDLPATATSVTTSPDCGPAAMCIGESTVVLDGIAVLPTRYEGLTPQSGISIRLVAYDQAKTEIASATVLLPPKQVSPQNGLVISPDGIPVIIELPSGFDIDTFAVERRGLIVETATQTRYRYRLLDRAEHATADEQMPVGEVSVTPTVIDGNESRIVAIGLERGTVFVTLSDGEAEAIDTTVWVNAFIDMIGDGESTLVVQAGPGFELAVGTGLMSWAGSYVDLIGAAGKITITTGGCFFDHITPQTDLERTPQTHERVGTVLRSDGSAMWCAEGVTVAAQGTEPFVESMLSSLNIRP